MSGVGAAGGGVAGHGGGGVAGAGGGAAGGAAGVIAAGPPVVAALAGPQAALALVQNLPDAVGDQVSALDAQQRDLKAQRALVQKQLKGEKKKQQRLMVKARGLSDADLLGIVASRAAQAKAKAKAKGKAKAKAKA